MADEIKEYAEQFEDALGRDSENRQAALDDIDFARMANQWPDAIRKQREAEGRPCLTINKLPSFIRQVVNDSRQNSPQIKVKPVDDTADIDTADILSGLIRNIEYTSNAGTAYDTAIDSSVTCGMGFFRICEDYADDEGFAQDLFIRRITNPLSVVYDIDSESIDGSDWRYAYMIEHVRKEEFKRRYGKADPVSFAGDTGDGMVRKDSSDFVRIAEMYEVIETPSKLLLLTDGQTIKEADYKAEVPGYGMSQQDLLSAAGIEVHRERKIMQRKVMRRILGADVIEEDEVVGKFIPIIPVFGEEVFYQGKRYLRSLVRDAKDAQANFNFWRTSSTELVALAPRAPFIGPTGAFDTDAKKWATANVRSHPYIEYDGGIQPQRQAFAGPPAGALQEAMNASDDIKSILGIYDASLGARSNETSGKAIMARQREGDTSTFHFIDNLSKSIAHAGRVLVDKIPKIYDTARVVRTLGLDGTTQAVKINQPTVHDKDGQKIERIFDLKVGKYDVAVETGPSFTTQRQESADQMTSFIQAYPQAAPIIGDLLAKNLDWPDAEEIAKRLKGMLPPQLQDGNGIPPQVQAQMKQMHEAMQAGMQKFQAMQQELQAAKTDNANEARKLEIDAYAAETERIKVQAEIGNMVATQIAQQQPLYQDQQNTPMPAGM